MDASFVRAETRAILSRHRVELPLLRVGAFGNLVRLQGVLKRAAGLPDLTQEALVGMEQELRRIPGVRRVELHLSNWRRQGREWKEISSDRRLELDPLEAPVRSFSLTD